MHGSPMGLPYGFAEEGKKPASLAGLFLQSGFLRLRHPAPRFAGLPSCPGAEQDALRSFSEEGPPMYYVYLLESSDHRR